MADEGEEDDLPEDHPKEEVPLEIPQEEDNELGETPLEDLDYPNDTIEGFGSEQPHYQWDKLNNEEAPSFQTNPSGPSTESPAVVTPKTEPLLM